MIVNLVFVAQCRSSVAVQADAASIFYFCPITSRFPYFKHEARSCKHLSLVCVWNTQSHSIVVAQVRQMAAWKTLHSFMKTYSGI